MFDDFLKAAENVFGWFKSEGWVKENEGMDEFMQKAPYCLGCRNDRTKHWAADCWILRCCVDEKNLKYCFECDDFPCKKLTEWAKENDHYKSALETLKQLKK